MEFDGLTSFRLGFPTISVGEETQQFDLHNDAGLRELNVDFREHSVCLVWTLEHSAWTASQRLAPKQRGTIASVALVFSAVQSLVVTGKLFENAAPPTALDFLEYSRDPAPFGQLRIVMLSSAEITIVAGRCRLRKIEAL
jgi:hypothetical protein